MLPTIDCEIEKFICTIYEICLKNQPIYILNELATGTLTSVHCHSNNYPKNLPI